MPTKPPKEKTMICLEKKTKDFDKEGPAQKKISEDVVIENEERVKRLKKNKNGDTGL